MVAVGLPFHIMHSLVTIYHFCYHKAHLSKLQDLHSMEYRSKYNLVHDYLIFLKRLSHLISQLLLQVSFNSFNPRKILLLIDNLYPP